MMDLLLDLPPSLHPKPTRLHQNNCRQPVFVSEHLQISPKQVGVSPLFTLLATTVPLQLDLNKVTPNK
ncbi:hypothetical protein Hanom_Chr04g00317351 [Helianthus anomalus]